MWKSYLPGSVTTHYVYDEAGHLLAEHDGVSGAMLREYVWLDDLPLAMIDSTGSSPAIYYIHTGQLGEPQMMTDAAQAKVWDAYVEPFGAAQTFSTATVNLSPRLPGQFADPDLGFSASQNGYRDYDTSLGRYIEADPLGIAAGQNLYVYAFADPLTRIDPTGLDVTINYYDSVTGHVGIQVDGQQSYGFYPNDPVPIDQGSIDPDASHKPVPTSSFKIRTTPAQDARIWAYIQSRRRNPGYWILIGRNCTNFVSSALRAGGLKNVPWANEPDLEYRRLRARFDPTFESKLSDYYFY